MADQDHSDDFTIERSPGSPPSRRDNRGLLHMLHDEIGKTLGIGKGDGTKYIPNQAPTVDDAVNAAVAGAPSKPSDY